MLIHSKKSPGSWFVHLEIMGQSLPFIEISWEADFPGIKKISSMKVRRDHLHG
jgi:hypothetical protein